MYMVMTDGQQGNQIICNRVNEGKMAWVSGRKYLLLIQYRKYRNVSGDTFT